MSSSPAGYRSLRARGQGRGRVLSAPVRTPWLEDACSLVDAFRAKELSPLEALDDCIAAIEASPLNAFSFTDFERAPEAARGADVSLPFGGVPFGVKELERVAGGPTRRPRCSSGTASPTTTTRRCPACGPPERCWPPRRPHRSSAGSTAPRPSCTGRRAIPGTPSEPGRFLGGDGGGGRRRAPADRHGQRRRRVDPGSRPASAACSA